MSVCVCGGGVCVDGLVGVYLLTRLFNRSKIRFQEEDLSSFCNLSADFLTYFVSLLQLADKKICSKHLFKDDDNEQFSW